MRFRVMSDLHFEFHADGGRAFVDALDVEPDEVLLLAGDVSSSRNLIGALSMLCRRFSWVFYVPGNHEYYGSDRPSIERALRRAEDAHGNLHRLDKDGVEFNGARILGCPLWFSRDDRAPKHMMNDFRLIRDFASWVYEENARCVEFLRREMGPGDIVLTHYLPSWRSVAERWQGSPLNPFFLCDMTSLIQDVQPALWVHGHTHDSMDYHIGKTRVVCNPFGYLGHEENPGFRATLRIPPPSSSSPSASPAPPAVPT